MNNYELIKEAVSRKKDENLSPGEVEAIGQIGALGLGVLAGGLLGRKLGRHTGEFLSKPVAPAKSIGTILGGFAGGRSMSKGLKGSE
jgi:uncharacterized protein YcfJ